MVGANHLTDEVDALTIAPFEKAFNSPWDADAHFVGYEPVNAGEGAWPRCNKPLLGRMRERGADLYANVLAFDFDNPGHAAWKSQEEVGEWIEKLSVVSERWPVAWQWTVLYTTRSGARLVYVPEDAIPVDEAESYHRGMTDKFASLGMNVDRHCSDWTRIFRLPAVLRGGERTWESDKFFIVMQREVRLALGGLPMRGAGATDPYADIEPYDGDQPTDEEAESLLECVNIDSGRKVMTEWTKQAKKRLKGRECYDSIFNHGVLAPSGRRDNTLHKYVGQVVGLLHSLAGTTPEHIYALMLSPVQQLDPDDSTPDWTAKLWDHVRRLWAKQDAKVRAKQEEADRLEEETSDEFEVIVEGMKSWCNSPALYASDPDAVRAWVERHMIASVASHFYVMGKDGYYCPTAVNNSQLIAMIRTMGMERHMPTKTLSADGTKVFDLPVVQLVNHYATICTKVKAIPSIPGATIEGIDTPGASLVLPAYERNPDLVPRFDHEVDQWLKHFFGDNYHIGCEWIAWALAFEEGPIAALSIEGEQGAGKKMLYVGLSECLKTPALATAKDLVGEYQYGLMSSPFLVVNEGWPTTRHAGHPADQFRHLVGGDPFPAQRKYHAPTDVVNPVRVIFAANNKDVVAELTRGRDLSVEDRNALAVRLLHFPIGSRASVWLREMGGHRFTAKPGNRWIRGDGNQPSDYIVARHFLWLHANRKSPPGVRFLVDGNANSGVMFEMRTGTQTGRIVIETLVKMVENRTQGLGEPPWTIEGGGLFVLPSGVLEYYRNALAHKAGERLTIATVQSVLKGLSRSTSYARVMESRESYGVQEWVEVDCRDLYAAAKRDGYRCPTIERLAEQQELEDGIRKGRV